MNIESMLTFECFMIADLIFDIDITNVVEYHSPIAWNHLINQSKLMLISKWK